MATHDTPTPGRFQPGDFVSITGGTFALLKGRVLSPEEATEWYTSVDLNEPAWQEGRGTPVWVLITLFGRPVPVQVDAAHLEPAAE